MSYTNVQWTEMVRLYAASGDNLSEARRRYAELFPGQPVPNRETMLAATQRLRTYGQFTVPTHAQGRGNQQLSVDLQERILNFFAENPEESTRRVASIFNVSHYTVCKILHNDGQHPYHCRQVQELNENDHIPRMIFSQWLIQNFDKVSILFTGEAMFTRSGIYNVHNEHYWGRVNEHRVRKNSNYQHSFSINVWAGIFNGNLLGPYFVDGHLNAQSYMAILRHVFDRMLENVPLHSLRNLYYQHDGAPAHFQPQVKALLDEKFPGRWIGRGGPVAWPARSPDLTPLDFYLWGEIKRRVYATKFNNNMSELKRRIRRAFRDLKEDTVVLPRVLNILRKRAEACVAVNGSQFEQLLESTTQEESEIETLVVKVEPPEYYEEPEIILQPFNVKSEPSEQEKMEEGDPISLDIKTEHQDEEVDNTNETLGFNEPDSTKRKGKKRQRKNDVTTQQQSRSDTSTAEPSSSGTHTEAPDEEEPEILLEQVNVKSEPSEQEKITYETLGFNEPSTKRKGKKRQRKNDVKTQ